jgi:hypothetical protein
MSWKPEVQTGNGPKWYGNGLRFAANAPSLFSNNESEST